MKQYLENVQYFILLLMLLLVGAVYVHRDNIPIIQAFLAIEGDAADVSAGDILGGDVSGGDISGGDVSGGDVSGGDISGGDVSGGDVSGGDISAGNAPKWHFTTVDEDYFDDALFIGDSRTVGLHDYAGLDNTTFYASTGLSIHRVFRADIVPVTGSRKKITIEKALQEKQFAKIYIMLGINELGTGNAESFGEKYGEVLARIRELQPDAIIYVQGIMCVSTKRSARGDYIRNEEIYTRNLELQKLENGKDIFYLDINPVISDEDGGLMPEYSFDGVHLKAAYVDIWKNYLLEHAVEFIE